MTEKKPRAEMFAEALGEGADLAFKRLASEIMKDGALSSKDKAIIALACAVAVKCEHCIKVHKERAMNAGAGRDEILEAAAVAGLVRLGSGFNAASFILED